MGREERSDETHFQTLVAMSETFDPTAKVNQAMSLTKREVRLKHSRAKPNVLSDVS